MKRPLLDTTSQNISSKTPLLLLFSLLLFCAIAWYGHYDRVFSRDEIPVGGITTPSEQPMTLTDAKARYKEYVELLQTSPDEVHDSDEFMQCIRGLFNEIGPRTDSIQLKFSKPPNRNDGVYRNGEGKPKMLELATYFVTEITYAGVESMVMDIIYGDCYTRDQKRRVGVAQTNEVFTANLFGIVQKHKEALRKKGFRDQWFQNGNSFTENLFDVDETKFKEIIIPRLNTWFYFGRRGSIVPAYRASFRFLDTVPLSEVYDVMFQIISEVDTEHMLCVKLPWSKGFTAKDDVVVSLFKAGKEVSQSDLLHAFNQLGEAAAKIGKGYLDQANFMPMQFHYNKVMTVADYANAQSFGQVLSGAIAEFFLYRPSPAKISGDTYVLQALLNDKCFGKMPRGLGAERDPQTRLDVLRMYSDENIWSACYQHFITIWAYCLHTLPTYWPKAWPVETLGEFNTVCLPKYVEELYAPRLGGLAQHE